MSQVATIYNQQKPSFPHKPSIKFLISFTPSLPIPPKLHLQPQNPPKPESRTMNTDVINALILIFVLLRQSVLYLYSPPQTATSTAAVATQMFENWCIQYGKSYPSAKEKLHRFRVFEHNLAFITLHNHFANSSYNLSLNSFADLTHEEFKATRLGFNPFFSRYNLTTKPRLVGDVPSSIDWREKGAVTNVKDQGSCGASWAFSATGAVEGVNMIVNGSLISLSEQHLIDCYRTDATRGCKSGHLHGTFQFTTEEEYPYQAFDMVCNEKVNMSFVTIADFTNVPRNNEEQLVQAVASQPVIARIVANCFDFQFYSKGIFNGSCSTSLYPGELDHALLIVGYGSENGVDYWILKNSWGKSWGMDGYMYMLRDHGNPKGVCGINMFASYPTTTPPPPSPTQCDGFTKCKEGETCCCTMTFFGICAFDSFLCCEFDSAVCCTGSLQCCPADYPICDPERNMCLQENGKSTGSGSLIGRSSRHLRRLLDPYGITVSRVEDEIIPGTLLFAQVNSFKPGNNSASAQIQFLNFSSNSVRGNE